MVLEGHFAISILNFIHGGILRNTKHFIIASFPVRIVLVEEFFLVVVLEPMFLVETFESFVRIDIGVVPMSNFVIVGSSVLVGKNLVSFSNVLEFRLGLFPVLAMPIRVPLVGQFFVSSIDFCLGRIRLEP